MDLFEKFKLESRITDAEMVARNIFNKNPKNYEVFKSYFDFLCDLAMDLPDTEDRKVYAEQASVALAFFKENAKLTEKMVDTINSADKKLKSIIDEIVAKENKECEKYYNEFICENEQILAQLSELKDKLYTAKAQQDFDELLVNVKNIEMEIHPDILTEEQSTLYDRLTKEYTDAISAKMLDFERKKNVEYNKQAVESYSKAFERFKDNENKFKNQSQLFALVSDSLFGYDASRLFNETLIYYNHIYSYIFAKLDDDGKKALTRYSIECEKNRR